MSRASSLSPTMGPMPGEPVLRPGAGPAATALAGRVLRAPFQRRTHAEFLYALASLPLALAAFVVTVGSLGAGAYLAITLVGLALISASTIAVRYLAGLNRRLARHLLGTRIVAPTPWCPEPGVIGWIRSGLTDAAGWRARAYIVLKLPVAVLGGVVAGCLWFVGLFYLTYPIWWAFAPGAAPGTRVSAPLPSGSLHVLTFPATFGVAAVGAVAVLAAPWGIRAVNALDQALILRLLGPVTPSVRVRELERSRAAAVDSADARLRGIERDLHDGAQAQLVAVAMKLSLAKDKLGGPDGAGGQQDVRRAFELVDTAQRTARDAIEELRGLARGIHPPVLDTGLEAALTTLAAHSAVPVRLIVDLPQRPSQAIETIAYFCAAELLANVAKHSQARHVVIEVMYQPGLLRLKVTDDGIGGADAGGSGLRGLAERVATVDGRLAVSSPRGGPTTVSVELPPHA
jgi:signal transduction histidine kinase